MFDPPTPEIVPPFVLFDDPDREHRVDALDLPARTGKFQSRLGQVLVSTLDFPGTGRPAGLLVFGVVETFGEPLQVPDEPVESVVFVLSVQVA